MTSTGSFATPFYLSAARCIARYIALPFVLPLTGAAAGASLAVLLILDANAAIALVTALRELWRTWHPRRWQYLPIALALAVFMGSFFVVDARMAYN